VELEGLNLVLLWEGFDGAKCRRETISACYVAPEKTSQVIAFLVFLAEFRVIPQLLQEYVMVLAELHHCTTTAPFQILCKSSFVSDPM
jgi:hypothetical protein